MRHDLLSRPGPFERGLRYGLCGFVALAAVYSVQPVTTQANRIVLYEGARLISGDGSAPVDDSALLVENGTITRVGRKGSVTAKGRVIGRGGARHVIRYGRRSVPEC